MYKYFQIINQFNILLISMTLSLITKNKDLTITDKAENFINTYQQISATDPPHSKLRDFQMSPSLHTHTPDFLRFFQTLRPLPPQFCIPRTHSTLKLQHLGSVFRTLELPRLLFLTKLLKYLTKSYFFQLLLAQISSRTQYFVVIYMIYYVF